MREGRLNLMLSSDGWSFGPTITFSEASDFGLYLHPSLLNWAGTDLRLNALSFGTDGTFAWKQTFEELSDAAPASVHNYMPPYPGDWYVWRGVEGEGQINIALIITGPFRAGSDLLGEQSIAGPCLLSLEGQCMYVFSDRNGRRKTP